MATFNGTDVYITINDVQIGRSISIALDMGQDLPDASSRDSLGWSEHIRGIRNASLSINGLTDYGNAMNYNEFAAFVITKESISFSFTNGLSIFSGVASVENIEEIANFEEVVSYNLDLKVNGFYAASDGSALLLETGDYLLLETGFKILL